MSSSYQIGLDPGALVDLIDDPFPASETELIGHTLAGSPIYVAWETITWEWEHITQVGFYQLWLFWTANIQTANPPPYVYIRTLQPDGFIQQYGIYRCKMGKPSWEKKVGGVEVRDLEIIFYQCEQVA